MPKQVSTTQHSPSTEIALISVRIHAPSIWTHQLGIRVFFEHEGETILDQFAYRYHRPIAEYTQLIRGPIADEIERRAPTFSEWKIKIRCVSNQQPFMGSYSEQWLPRDAFVIVVPKAGTKSFYTRILNYEVLATVKNL